jgi:hypothetical protein
LGPQRYANHMTPATRPRAKQAMNTKALSAKLGGNTAVGRLVPNTKYESTRTLGRMGLGSSLRIAATMPSTSASATDPRKRGRNHALGNAQAATTPSTIGAALVSKGFCIRLTFELTRGRKPPKAAVGLRVQRRVRRRCHHRLECRFGTLRQARQCAEQCWDSARRRPRRLCEERNPHEPGTARPD